MQLQFAGAATEQRVPGRTLCNPGPCASLPRRYAVPSLFHAADGPAAIRSCSTPPFAASMRLILAAFTRSASPDGAPPPAARLLLICFSFSLLFLILSFFLCGIAGGGVGGIRSAERRGKARTSRMDVARERNEPWMANPRGPYGLSDKRGDSAMRCARTPQGADCKGPRPRTFARPPARCC
ncbi:hypothetical protein Pat9b_0119 [Pantoea sp. At-9b]|nr:hypothetical protein Pat9b_0119 [Pantoea sp. At-9b]